MPTTPEAKYVGTAEGFRIAYALSGSGPIDIVPILDTLQRELKGVPGTWTLARVVD